MTSTTASRRDAARAVARGIDFLLRCRAPRGAVLEPVADPLAVLTRPGSLSKRALFHAMGGADVWHTVNALDVLARHGRSDRGMRRFLSRRLQSGDGLCYWSARIGLCCETTAVMARLAGASVRRRLTTLLRRKAYPAGRWPSYILDGAGRYEQYMAAPSVTAFVLSLLAPSDPLYRAGSRYLESALDGRAIWGAQQAFYLTPFYPAHVAAAIVRRRSVVDYTLSTQDTSGGWGFGDPPSGPCATLPTALAISTLRCFPRKPALERAIVRAVGWLLSAQARNGAFPRGKAPNQLYYLGDVYSTCVALLALSEA